jgi:hypothetical protein
LVNILPEKAIKYYFMLHIFGLKMLKTNKSKGLFYSFDANKMTLKIIFGHLFSKESNIFAKRSKIGLNPLYSCADERSLR